MHDQTTPEERPSSVAWETLETFVRLQAQKWVQRLLEEEVSEALGRLKSQRRARVDGAQGYRHGYGRPRKLTLTGGTIELRRPRVRGLTERFVSKVLPLFQRQSKEVDRLLPELYLHGLSSGDFDLALRGLLGEAAPLSASAVDRLKVAWQAEYETWNQRPLHELEAVYLWVDGVYVKAGLEKDKAAVLVAVAALRDGHKVVLAVQSGARESTASWGAILRDLKARGLRCPRLVVGDGHLGIWGALAAVFPEAREQRCWNHRIVNVLDKLPRKVQAVARELLTGIPYAASRQQAERAKQEFQRWCRQHGYEEAGLLLEQDWERMLTFYGFPRQHWKHLRTTNVIESPFALVRLRTSAAKRYKKVKNATAVIWKTLLVAERTFRKLDAPELLAEVAQGVCYVDGVGPKQPKAKGKGKSKVPA
jgi:transposase-like protein